MMGPPAFRSSFGMWLIPFDFFGRRDDNVRHTSLWVIGESRAGSVGVVVVGRVAVGVAVSWFAREWKGLNMC